MMKGICVMECFKKMDSSEEIYFDIMLLSDKKFYSVVRDIFHESLKGQTNMENNKKQCTHFPPPCTQQ